MKKLLLLLLCLPLLFYIINKTNTYNEGASERESARIEQNIKEMDAFFDSLGISKVSPPKTEPKFVIAKDFVEASDSLLREYLFDVLLSYNISTEERLSVMNDWLEKTKLYINRNNDEENLVIKEEKGIIIGQEFLDIQLSFVQENQDMLGDNQSDDLIDSGIGKFKDRFNYVYLTSVYSNKYSKRFNSNYFISINNTPYHIIINTFNNSSLEDILLDIN
jgi:hypothetical protein